MEYPRLQDVKSFIQGRDLRCYKAGDWEDTKIITEGWSRNQEKETYKPYTAVKRKAQNRCWTRPFYNYESYCDPKKYNYFKNYDRFTPSSE